MCSSTACLWQTSFRTTSMARASWLSPMQMEASPIVLGSKFPLGHMEPRQPPCCMPHAQGNFDCGSCDAQNRSPTARQGPCKPAAWSPDGKWFLGTASHLGPYWNIALMSATVRRDPRRERNRSLQLHAGLGRRLTADCLCQGHHSRETRARGIVGGDNRRPVHLNSLYAEQDRHIYGACASPDQNI
jgi:hypothetical protein